MAGAFETDWAKVHLQLRHQPNLFETPSYGTSTVHPTVGKRYALFACGAVTIMRSGQEVHGHFS